MEDLTPPHIRADQIGRAGIEAQLRRHMADSTLSHGWIIAGGKGAGKATLAYRIARGLLDPSALASADSFEVAPAARVFRLVAGQAHPDLFVAQRLWDEKKSRHQAEITVETIRKLTQFLNRTAAGSGFRVAIIDAADDMNRNAANALLKMLEEPPKKTLLLLLANAPGRLIATVRSRCRRLDLRPLPDADIVALLDAQGLGQAGAETIAAHAGGRPGYALTLAAGEGGAAIKLAHQFLSAARQRGDIAKIAGALSGKAGDGRWSIFRNVVLENLSDAARAGASGEALEGPLAGAAPQALLEAWEQLTALVNRGEALNLDRSQLIGAMAHDLRLSLAQYAP